MQKILPIFVIGILILSGLGVVVGHSAETSKKVEKLTFSEPIIQQKEEYLTVHVKEANTYIMHEDEPVLPVFTKTFTFPFGTKIKNVECVISGVRQILLSGKIISGPKPVPLISVKKAVTKTIEKQNVYGNADLFPDDWISYRIGCGSDGVILNIKFYPVRYAPAQDLIRCATGAELKVIYEKPSEPICFLDEYDLMIVAPSAFSDKLQPLIDHKNSHGIRTILKTTEDIYSGYSEGRDAPEKIKLCIYDVKETYNISYVLLVGGRKGQTFDWYMPERVTNNDDGWEGGYASDLYYGDIYKYDAVQGYVFEDWDDNGNGVFAEWSNFAGKKDQPDYYPDVSVGRLPCRYLSDVDVVVNKIINYENTADDLWFKKAVVISGDTFPPARGGAPGWNEGEMETGVTVGVLEDIGFDVEKLWLSLGAWSGREDVVNAINKGVGFIHFAGHGNPAYWGNFLPDAETEEGMVDGLILQDMNKLKNDGKLPVIIVGGCHNAQFNVTMSNIITGILEYGLRGYFFEKPFRFFYKEWVPRSFCSWLVMQKGGGAIASTGNTGLGYGYVNADATAGLGGWIEPRFFDAYANQSIDVLGEAHAQAITDYINIIGNVNSDQIDRKTIEEWVLLGDPSLKIGGYS
ncbi:Peptidase C25, gingipain [Thermoplasmatales archaeon SCGC AB-539-N05]|nr:Peptidase C25, gingipain [Thermoplasmatales archaeon SCGC AB-539-N05]